MRATLPFNWLNFVKKESKKEQGNTLEGSIISIVLIYVLFINPLIQIKKVIFCLIQYFQFLKILKALLGTTFRARIILQA